MDLLLTIKEQDIMPQSPIMDSSTFKTRGAARAVLLDKDGAVYLLNVRLHDYHKLPGGGIDEGEDTVQALERELLEEVGCKAKIISELGQIVEHRNYEQLVQTSYCYLARQVGNQTNSALEEGELAEGMVEAKAQNVDEAIKLLSSDKPDNLEGKFIQKRDVTFLQVAKEMLAR